MASPVAAVGAAAAGAEGLASGSGVAIAVLLLLMTAGGAWIARDLPATIRELREAVGQWAAAHEVRRVVDCRPWGLEREFVIAQDGATTSPSDESSAVPWAPGACRRYEYGLCLWNGAVALTRLLLEEREELRAGALADGRSVVELGCGQALVAMVVAEAFPGVGHIVATDGCDDVLLAAQGNIARNLAAPVAARLQLARLRWGNATDSEAVRALNGGRAFDVLLGADVTYMEEHDAFVDALVDLSHSSSEVWISHEPRRHPTEALVARLRREFCSVKESQLELSPEATGREEGATIVIWRCSGKAA
mmetsp:Transcript_38567/g.110764  ORF Transcript_38567/g.110764 Transcript_38567/m.110764 type:complete len:307 (-) Transcript_38567:138-1058(-)